MKQAGSREGSLLGIRLRPLRHRDFDRVLQLELAIFGRGAWTYGMLAEELRGRGRWYLVAERDAPEVVGRRGVSEGVAATPRRTVVGYAGLWYDGEVAQVMTLGVDPTVRRQGIGSMLLQALIERAVALRARSMFLEVRVDNEAALALYQAYGFERVGLRKRYYQPEDKDAYTMVKQLQ